MKAITLHVDEPVYKDFQNFARQKNRSTSDLIREAMLQYHHKISQENRPSILDAPPRQVFR
jgi:predicted transcriptional regulator